ncbi:hypothetical protein B1812_10030 [Methylocystis bryophila]|uniref:Uncharacterized protein n=1 Tax=Methylocystis bryophila TaxID=655015 RepID=A0A1W6MUS3_9HYPH|nr:hypothetical protein B1812_10030 [Methylocystis bryophila]
MIWRDSLSLERFGKRASADRSKPASILKSFPCIQKKSAARFAPILYERAPALLPGEDARLARALLA